MERQKRRDSLQVGFWLHSEFIKWCQQLSQPYTPRKIYSTHALTKYGRIWMVQLTVESGIGSNKDSARSLVLARWFIDQLYWAEINY